nr:cortexin domain-containing 1 protein isoform X1 [Desmodus rotundus]
MFGRGALLPGTNRWTSARSRLHGQDLGSIGIERDRGNTATFSKLSCENPASPWRPPPHLQTDALRGGFEGMLRNIKGGTNESLGPQPRQHWCLLSTGRSLLSPAPGCDVPPPPLPPAAAPPRGPAYPVALIKR